LDCDVYRADRSRRRLDCNPASCTSGRCSPRPDGRAFPRAFGRPRFRDRRIRAKFRPRLDRATQAGQRGWTEERVAPEPSLSRPLPPNDPVGANRVLADMEADTLIADKAFDADAGHRAADHSQRSRRDPVEGLPPLTSDVRDC
jgi:hypothetical protein